eukprot:5513625-Prymnesium_polylepis.1
MPVGGAASHATARGAPRARGHGATGDMKWPRPAAARPGAHDDDTPASPGHAIARASASSAAPTVTATHGKWTQRCSHRTPGGSSVV